MKKSILALLLAVLMVASLLPATALAVEGPEAKIGEQEYPTLAEAVNEVKDNETIVLLKDVTVETSITLKGNGVTLDLGEFTVSSDSTVFVIGDGTNPASVKIANGKVISYNMSWGAAVGVAKKAHLTVAADAEIVGPYGLGTSNTKSTDAGLGVVIDVYGTVRGIDETDDTSHLSYGGTVGIGINGNIKSTTDYAKINIYPGAVVSGTNGYSGKANDDAGPAIYAAGYAEWNIYGGEFSGAEALSIKSGKFNISGGNFNAYGEFYDPATAYGNGTEATGAAISITSNDSYAKNITMNITGGVFNSEHGYALYEDVTNSTSSPLSDEGISLSGGSFAGGLSDEGDLKVAHQDNFVTNGEFSKEVATDYLDTDLKYQVKNGSTYSYYDTFENALKAAENGAEIKGVADAPGKQYYTITIDPANGGTVLSYKLPSGSPYTLPTVSKSGYAFLGWSDGVNTYPAGTVITLTSNVTYTASWVRHPDTPYVPEPSEPVEPDVPSFPFYDVPASAWYYTAVKYVYDNKLMDGVDTYVFAPNDTLTRAMVWTIIARMSGVDTTGGNSWYAKAQEWVITNGISDGENPTAAITREEFVTMLWRLAGEPVYTGDLSRVPDAGSISTWAQNAMLWSYATGLTEGDENGALTPLATATRAQAAAMIMRFCESVK